MHNIQFFISLNVVWLFLLRLMIYINKIVIVTFVAFIPEL